MLRTAAGVGPAGKTNGIHQGVCGRDRERKHQQDGADAEEDQRRDRRDGGCRCQGQQADQEDEDDRKNIF